MSSSDGLSQQSAEETAPYSAEARTDLTTSPAPSQNDQKSSVFDGVRKIRTVHLVAAKEHHEKFAMLTTYDFLTAQIFDEAGVEVLLIGDSAGNTVLGHESTLTITLDQMIPMVNAVSRGAKRALVVADMPFGSYQESPQQAVASAVRMMKEGGAHAVKMEVTEYYAEHVRAVSAAGIPVMAHIGFTPQSEHALGGFRVQGRGDAAAKVLKTALAMQEAGAFCLLMEMVTSDVAQTVDEQVHLPIIGIGAGASTTGQVLVWQDAFGMRQGKMARFVKQYADVHSVLLEGAKAYHRDVQSGQYPGEEHQFRQ